MHLANAGKRFGYYSVKDLMVLMCSEGRLVTCDAAFGVGICHWLT